MKKNVFKQAREIEAYSIQTLLLSLNTTTILYPYVLFW